MIIIFGSSGTLGTSILESLSLKGIDYGITTNSREKELKKIIKKKNLNPKFIVKCDVTKFDQVKRVFLKALKIDGKITGIINNFAYTYQSSNKIIQSKIKKKIFEVNYFGLVNVLEGLLLTYKFNKIKPVKVINILSNAIKTLNASNEHYISSKAAAKQLSKYYAYHYGSKMNVNCVAPGLMLSNLTKKRFFKEKKKIIRKVPLKRLVHPDEVAELIIKILVDLSGLNGETIYIDGGRTIELND